MMNRPHNEYGHQSVPRQHLSRGDAIASSSSPGSGRFSPSSSATPELAASWSACGDSAIPRSSPLTPFLFPLRDLSIVELLDQDDRPTFIVDLNDKSNFRPGPLLAVFANTALRAEQSIFGSLVTTAYDPTAEKILQAEDFVRFKTWILTTAGSNGRAHERSPSVSSTASTFSSHLVLAGLRWTCSALRQRYRVVRGSRCSCTDISSTSSPDASDQNQTLGTAAAQECPLPNKWLLESDVASPTERIAMEGEFFGAVASAADPPGSDKAAAAIGEDNAHPSLDWTQIDLRGDVPEHIRFARSVDWAATPLGPIELWPADLRTMANMVMGSPNAAAMYWGPEFTTIYNEAYVSLAAQYHPQLMGSSGLQIWGDGWADMNSIFHNVWNSGQAIVKYDDRVYLNRNGFLEETFLNWSIIPLVGSDGSVAALFNSVWDNTKRWVNERRMLTLNELGERTSKAQTIRRFWQSVRQGLEKNDYDVPFVLIYSVATSTCDEEDESEDPSLHTGCICSPANVMSPSQVMLEGSLGVSPEHAAAVAALDLQTSNEGFAPYMRQSMAMAATESATDMATPIPMVLSAEDGSLPAGLLDGLQGQRGFGDDCHTVVVFPVYHPTALTAGAGCAAMVAGFIVMGTNPRRPYNQDYRLFVHLLARQLTTSLSSAVLFEEETRRAERLARRAVRDQQELSQQLQLRTQQVVESENKFMRMAEFTPVGMFVTDSRGRITYCNDMCWEIAQHRRPIAGSTGDSGDSGNTRESMPVLPYDGGASIWSSWMESVETEDRPDLEAVWERMVREKEQVTHEFRFRQKTTQPINAKTSEKTEMTMWVLLRAYPEKDEKTGELKSIFGCIMDISQQKLAEAFESQRRQEAVEHKRQQENFIDITSHEMRNPLSAILQSVDEITDSVSAFRAESDANADADNDADADANAVDDLLEDVLEATSTISLCANHQKRIVEDVLTLSKLDSKLLLVRPVDVQPVTVVRTTLKMFEAEFYAHDIRCTLRIQPSYEALVGAEGWLKLDPSRLAQVIINLITNAVRFTQAGEDRAIMISLGATREGDPVSQPGTVDVADDVADGELVYIPRRLDDAELQPEGPEWGTGERLNLHVAVADTGKDLNKGERDILFRHYAHQLPRTHVEYGGPGLGLFISWNLAELQGGQIGVASRKDHGSVFAFYVKCRRGQEDPLAYSSATEDATGLPAVALSSFLTVYSGLGDGGNGNGNSNGNGNDNGNSSGGDSEANTTIAGSRILPAALRHYQPSRATSLLPLSAMPFFAGRAARSPRSARTARASAAAAKTATSDAAIGLTAVDLTLAAATAANMSLHKGGLLPATTNVASLAPPSANMPPLDVLIVEDNIVNQRVLQRQLDKCGNRTHVANHGEEALDALRRSRFWRGAAAAAAADECCPVSAKEAGEDIGATSTDADTNDSSGNSQSSSGSGLNISIILMDLEMPVMDGMTCARAIRDLERSGTLVRHVPIIAVTAYARPEQIENAKAAGIDDVIAKPFRLAQLMPKILELVKKYQTI